jgi:AraC family transcriptional regulator
LPQGAHGLAVARCFRLSEAPTVFLGTTDSVGIAVTRLQSSAALEGRSVPLPREDAYSLALHLRESADHELWLRGRHVYKGAYRTGAVSLVDLSDEPIARIGNPFDILQIYVSRQSLDEVAAEHGAPPVRDLNWARGAPDETAMAFASLLLPTLTAQRPDTLYADNLLLALRIHVARAYGGIEAARFRAAGGLASWQERRAKDIIQARYAGSLSIADLARECGLSPSHFTRAFRTTTGVQPHRWLSQVRIEAAKQMLVAGEMPLARIALACGFGDQSHFTRMFTRDVGISPGAWQRRRRG